MVLVLLVPVVPQRVLLREAVLEDVAPVAPVLGDVRAGAAAVARVPVPALAEVLLDDGAEGPGQDAAVGDVRRLQAAGEGAGVDGLGEGGAVAGEEGGVEGGEVAGLGFALGGEVGVEPELDAVAVEEGPFGLESVSMRKQE